MPAFRPPIRSLLALALVLGFTTSPAIGVTRSAATEPLPDHIEARRDAAIADGRPQGRSGIVSPLPPGAVGPSHPGRLTATLDASGRIDVQRPGGNVAGLLRPFTDPRENRFFDPVRAVVAARSANRLWSPPAATPPVTDAQGDEPEPTGTRSYPEAGGDLTGDGLEDFLVYEVDLSANTIALIALRGTDGKELWRVESSGTEDVYAYSVGDITGDGSDDLFLAGYEPLDRVENETCTEAGCTYDFSETHDVVVGVRSGDDGAKLWSKRYRGSSTYHFEDEYVTEGPNESYRAEEWLRSTNRYLVPLLSGDHDGDEVRDVIVNAIDRDFDVTYEFESTGVPSEGISLSGSESLSIAERFANRTSLFDGQGGTLLSLLKAERAPRIGFLDPGLDVTDDRIPELIWSTFELPDYTASCSWDLVLEECSFSDDASELTIEALDGSSLEQVWDARVTDVWDAFPIVEGPDASRDGTADVLVWSWHQGGETFGLDVFDGRDGDALWRRVSVEDHFPVAIGELGGQAGDDLLTGSFRYPPPQDPIESLLEGSGDELMVLSRLDGSTGATLLETTYSTPSFSPTPDFGFYLLYLGAMSDASGDGQPDGLFGTMAAAYMENPDTGEYELNETRSGYRLESGVDGTSLHTADGPGMFEMYPEPDLDGDARAEISEWTYPWEDEEGQSTVEFLSLLPTSTLWGMTIPVEDAWEMTLWPSSDQDGAPGAEVIFGHNTNEGGQWRSLVSSRSGIDGEERWRRER